MIADHLPAGADLHRGHGSPRPASRLLSRCVTGCCLRPATFRPISWEPAMTAASRPSPMTRPRPATPLSPRSQLGSREPRWPRSGLDSDRWQVGEILVTSSVSRAFFSSSASTALAPGGRGSAARSKWTGSRLPVRSVLCRAAVGLIGLHIAAVSAPPLKTRYPQPPEITGLALREQPGKLALHNLAPFSSVLRRYVTALTARVRWISSIAIRSGQHLYGGPMSPRRELFVRACR